MEDKLLYKIYVSGHVQGVGFRWHASHEAKNRGITGFVKNLSDGRVYIEAEGHRDLLNDYLEWCKDGPGFVDEVTADQDSPVGYRDFRITY